MRPVLKPRLPDFAFGLSADVLLLQALGEYCSICERPLPAENWIWHKRWLYSYFISHVEDYYEIRLPSGPSWAISGSMWHDVLIVDHNCFRAQDDVSHKARDNFSHKHKMEVDLLYPDEDRVCFTLGPDSPITYELEEVTRVLTSDDGGTRQSIPIKAVIAKGNTPAAKATIDFFQLNSRYYNSAQREFRIPEGDYLAHADRRVEQRTRVWSMAERVSGAIITLRDRKDGETNFLNIFLEQARLAIAAAGFWSTWATVFGKRLNYDRELLGRLFLPRPEEWTAGSGPHNTFPGTRNDWLPASK